VQYHSTEDELMSELVPYVSRALASGHGVVTVATSAHRIALELLLIGRGFDIEALEQDGAYVTATACALTDACALVDDVHLERFEAAVMPLLERAGAGGRPVWVYGEAVDALAADGRFETALALEAAWNALRDEVPFDLYCGYDGANLRSPREAELVAAINACHTSVRAA
jgi:hypothetical protein